MKSVFGKVVLTFSLYLGLAIGANAASLVLTPATQSVVTSGNASVDLVLVLDEPSYGGGFVFDFSGPVTFLGFTPSTFWMSLDTAPNDTDFTGFGGSFRPANTEFELHLGSFNPFASGSYALGTLLFASTSPGTALITSAASPDTYWGPLVNVSGFPLPTTYGNASIQVTAAVPLPAATWLLLSAIGALTMLNRRRAVQ